jgi:hypothetical protein
MRSKTLIPLQLDNLVQFLIVPRQLSIEVIIKKLWASQFFKRIFNVQEARLIRLAFNKTIHNLNLCKLK